MVLGIDGGTLNAGARADITLFDPRPEWIFTEDTVMSKSKNTPFIGETYTGRVVKTLVEGRTVYTFI